MSEKDPVEQDPAHEALYMEIVARHAALAKDLGLDPFDVVLTAQLLRRRMQADDVQPLDEQRPVV